MKENSTHKKMSKRKKLIIILSPICAAIIAASIVTTVILTTKNKVDEGENKPPVIENPDDDDNNDDGDNKDDDKDQSTSGEVTSFADPVKDMNIIHTFGFYYNSTLNSYYEHQGIDVSADAGTEVYATTDGEIKAVYKDDELSGNQIVLNNGAGIVTIYSFIDPLENLKAGDKVSKGDVIGTISAPTGSEYKDGAHVHIEVYVNDKAVDPENYLVSSEK